MKGMKASAESESVFPSFLPTFRSRETKFTFPAFLLFTDDQTYSNSNGDRSMQDEFTPKMFMLQEKKNHNMLSVKNGFAF